MESHIMVIWLRLDDVYVKNKKQIKLLFTLQL